jgi:hypothetical protein
MSQLSLFATRPELAVPSAPVASEPTAKIRVHRRCCACPGVLVDWHTPILSPEQMRAAGWLELEPNVWATPGKLPCSRYCQTRMGLAEPAALALIP